MPQHALDLAANHCMPVLAFTSPRPQLHTIWSESNAADLTDNLNQLASIN